MRAKTWAPAVLALVLGGAAAYLVRNMMIKPSATATGPASQRTIQVVVANNDLIAGQDLRAENLGTTTIPTPSTPLDYCTRPAELIGRVLNAPVLKGQNIMQSNLAPRGAAATLVSLVPAGMRAMTINVDEGNSQAGMLVPGCHVDVMATFANGRKSLSRTLIKNVLIQAVGQRLTSAKSEDGKEPPAYHTVTLIVTPREGQIIDLIAQSGKMRLLLRGLMKSDEDDPGNTTESDIQGPDSESQVASAGPATRPVEQDLYSNATEKRTVVLIKGSTSSQVQFDIDKRSPEAGGNDLKESPVPNSGAGSDNRNNDE